MVPGLAMPSNRAAILTPSPIRSPSLSSTTSPRWMPMRNSMRRSGGRPALRSTMPFCTSMAQRTASTTLRNSTMAAIAGALDHAPVMYGDCRVDQIAAERSQPRKGPLLVGASKPAVSDHIRRQNGCEFPGLGHGSPFTTRQSSTINRSGTGPWTADARSGSPASV